ncbi:MAG: hypothetical protein K8T90_07335 [Planctomycetes bacterium]|nr:hypothetical protein [Planctomycetota bacterium]
MLERDVARAAAVRDAAWNRIQFQFLQVEGLPWCIFGRDYEFPADLDESVEWWVGASEGSAPSADRETILSILSEYDRTASGAMASIARCIDRSLSAGGAAVPVEDADGPTVLVLVVDGALYRVPASQVPSVGRVVESVAVIEARRRAEVAEALR